MSIRLANKRLYLAALAQQLQDMDAGRVPMQALLYRVLAKRMHRAAAGFPEAALRGHFGSLNPQIDDVLEVRHFDHFGELRHHRSVEWRQHADALLRRIRALPGPALKPARSKRIRRSPPAG